MSLQRSLLYFLALVAPAISSDNCKNIATFNTGLVATIPNAETRRAGIVEALKRSTADVVCLQEVWHERDLEPLLRGVRHVFPHHFSKIHSAKDFLRKDPDCLHENESIAKPKDTPCTGGEGYVLFARFLECGIEKGCLLLTGIAQSLCWILDCSEVMRRSAVSTDCMSCIFFEQFRAGGLNEAISLCVIPTAQDNRLNSPGIVLLSRQQLTKVSYTPFFPLNRTLVERGYIEATLEDGKKIVCTHLSANISVYFEYELSFSGYEEQSLAEVNLLGSRFVGKEHILVGDLNTGPSVTGEDDDEKNLEGDFVENYRFLMETFGYVSPFYQRDGRCTLCNDNPLAQGQPNSLIDAVLLVNGSSFEAATVHRVFDSEPLSDHYGVQATVCDR